MSYHEELANHLASQSHPMPHPTPKMPLSRVPCESRKCCTGNCNQGRACVAGTPVIKQPEPAEKARSRADRLLNYALIAMYVVVSVGSAIVLVMKGGPL